MSLRKLGWYLLGLLLVAGGYFTSEYYHRQKEQQEEKAQKVFQIKVDQIKSLLLKTDRGEIKLLRGAAGDQTWRLIQPLSAPVDQITLKSVLDTLAELKSRRRLTGINPERWRDFGLDKPLLTVEFEAGDHRHRLRFGAKVPGDGQYYAQVDEDDTILLLAAADKESLDRNLTAFRDKTLFNLAPDQVTAITISRGQDTLTVQRQGESWTAPGPPPLKIRPDKVEGWLRQVQFSRIVEFVAEKPTDPGRYGLATPAVRLTLIAGERQETLQVGSLQGDRYYAQKQGQPPVFQIERQLVDNLPKNAAAWEERRLWPGPETQVQQLSWGPPEKKTTAGRTREGWQLTLPEGEAPAEAAMRVNLLLWKIKELEYSRVTPAPPATAAAFSLQLAAQDGKPLLLLEELRTENGQTLLRWQLAGQVQGAWVAQAAWEALKQELTHLTAPKAEAAKQ